MLERALESLGSGFSPSGWPGGGALPLIIVGILMLGAPSREQTTFHTRLKGNLKTVWQIENGRPKKKSLMPPMHNLGPSVSTALSVFLF